MAEKDSFEKGERWDSYSIYAEVGSEIASNVWRATKGLARIDSAHGEDAQVDPEFAAVTKSHILTSALQLRAEMKRVEGFEKTLGDWTGPDGYIHRLRSNVRLSEESPGWVYEFVNEMLEIAWVLGYTRAGRVEKDPRSMMPEESDEQAREMLRDIMN